METNSHQQAASSTVQRVTTPSPVVQAPSDDDSLYRKGVKLLFGIGMERDLRRAVQCFREGYAKGDHNAGYMLVECLSSGDGTARDFDKSFQIALDLVDKGFYPAYYLVANAYTSGRGTVMDPEKGEAYVSKVFEYCSEPLPGVDESIRFEALLASMGIKDEEDWYAIERTARKYREISDWPTRHGWLAMSLLQIAGESASAKQEMLEIIEAGCAENDVLSFSVKTFVEVAQEQYKEAQQTAKLGLKIVPGFTLLCDLMWTIASHLNDDIDKVKHEFWRACALGDSVMSRGNDLGVKIEIEVPHFVGGWIVYREDIAEEKIEKDQSFYQEQPVIVVKNTSDEKLEGATIRICSEDVKLDRTFPLKPIPPHGEISLEAFDLDDIQYGEKLYVRVSKGDRYSEMALDTAQGLNDFRLPFMPLMLTWKSGTLGGCILRLRCLEGTLSNIVVTKQSGATARIPSLEVTQGSASVGWREFSDGSCLTPLENFVVQCDGYAPITGFIKLL